MFESYLFEIFESPVILVDKGMNRQSENNGFYSRFGWESLHKIHYHAMAGKESLSIDNCGSAQRNFGEMQAKFQWESEARKKKPKQTRIIQLLKVGQKQHRS